MKRQIIFTFIFLIVVLGGFLGYKELTKKNNVDPIENAVASYKNYKFHDLKISDDLFKIDDLKVSYDMTKESSAVKINDISISAYLIDDIVHIMVKDVDYKYPDLGEIDRLMFYKYCNCNNECYRLVVLTEEGTMYYVDLSNSIDYNDPSIFKKIESVFKFKNIGYTNDLLIDNECGVNGLVAITDDDKEIIFDNAVHVFNQAYYTYLKLKDNILYVFPGGFVSLNGFNMTTNKFIEIYTSFNSFYLVGTDSKLYELDLNNNLIKLSDKTITKIGYNKKDEIIILFSDATAKKLRVSNVLK